jgi:hypothetical protein
MAIYTVYFIPSGTSGDPTITTTTTSVPAIANNARASPRVSSFAN